MRGVPSSPRKRRRLAWGAGVLLALGALVPLGIEFSNTGTPVPTTLSNEPARFYPEPKTVPLTRSDRRAAEETIAKFVRTAVRREHVADSWELVTPSLRQGLTRAEWATGDIPVMPYPAVLRGLRDWRVLYSYKNDLGLDLLLRPRRGAQIGPIAFSVELKAFGSGAKRRWLVSSFYPRAVFPGEAEAKAAARARQAPSKPLKPPPPDRGKLSPLWFLVPGSIFGLLVLLPVGLAVRSWHQGVRARRAYGSK